MVANDTDLNKMPHYIGARLKSATVLDNYEPGYFLSPRANKKYEYTTEPITLQLTQYYMDLVKDGALLAADEASAKLCGVPYVDVKTALKRAAEKAANHCFAAYGCKPNWYVEPTVEVKAEPKSK